MNNILRTKDIIRLTLVLLLIFRIIIIAIYADLVSPEGKYFLFRHSIYTIAWATLLWFFNELTFEGSDTILKIKVIKMKQASFWAMIACFAKFCVTLYYQMPFNFPSYLTLIYTVLELLAWLLLTIFFFMFWRRKKLQEENVK